MIFSRPLFAALLALGLMSAPVSPANAQGQLNMACAMQIEWCNALATAFEKRTGTKVGVTQKSTGEILAQIRAEKENPKIDLWFGGTSDPHLIAAEEGLTTAHRSPNMAYLHPWAQKLSRQAQDRTVGISMGVLALGYNSEILDKRSIAPPRSWEDLLSVRFKGEIQMANPNSSGTAYVIIATLVQIMGEDKAFEYLKKLHANINSYTRSGVAPAKAVARGETAISISFAMDLVTERNAGFPVKFSYPSEGTGFEVAGMSIIKGARNLTQAKAFYEWYLTPEAMALGATVNQFHFPSHLGTRPDPRIPDVSSAKLVDYDFAKYGSSAERRRLLARWDAEIGALPR